MIGANRRQALQLGLGAAASASLALTGCGRFDDGDHRPVRPSQSAGGKQPRLIGDGSTSDTGSQPNQRAKPVPLEPGQTPPQFVVFSWDGAGDVGDGLFSRFLQLSRDHNAHMTFFLSGIYLLPESQRGRYRPPNNPIGASDIGYLTDAHIKDTLACLRQAWMDGHEIGTHFNGHFCSGSGSVAHWTPSDWRSEIDQARSFVKEWRTNSGWRRLPPLPFDYDKELVGGRTPCLLGQNNLLPTARALGWRYDASSPGGEQRWPRKRFGLWDLPLQAIPFPGHRFEVLSMDYNILANQSVATTRGPSYNYPAWKDQATQAFAAGFDRAYQTNRAPLFIGNHFERWNGGIYMDAVEESIKRMAGKPEVHLVSFRQLTDWLDVQSPALLARLAALHVGQRPPGGWKRYLQHDL